MDFGTILGKIDNNAYETQDDFCLDVQLVFSNAILFNPPDSQVHIDALLLKMRFEVDFMPDNLEVDPEDDAYYHEIFYKLMGNPSSAIFKIPVDKDLYPAYYKMIKDPIDLAIIAGKVESKKYASLQYFHTDIRKLFNNCFRFNKKDTFGYTAGKELETFYNSIRKPTAQELLHPVIVKTVPVTPPKLLPKITTPIVKVEPPPLDPEDFKMYLNIWEKFSCHDHSAIFRQPVDAALYPAYYKIIKDPIDLAVIRKKIDDMAYATPLMFHQDIRKLFYNCYKFNRKGTFGKAAGRVMEAYYNSIRKIDSNEVPTITIEEFDTPVQSSVLETPKFPPIRIKNLVAPATQTPLIRIKLKPPTNFTPNQNSQTMKPLKLKLGVRPINSSGVKEADAFHISSSSKLGQPLPAIPSSTSFKLKFKKPEQ